MAKKPMGRPKIYSDAYIEKTADELVKWSKNPHAFFIKDFTADHPDEITINTFDEWLKTNKYFSGAYAKVRDRLICRMRKGALMKVTDSSTTHRLLPLIDPEYRAWCRENAKLESESKQSPTIVITNYKPSNDEEE
jgi:hypothetical protein